MGNVCGSRPRVRPRRRFAAGPADCGLARFATILPSFETQTGDGPMSTTARAPVVRQIVTSDRTPMRPLLRAALAGTGRCLPERVVRNTEFPASIQTSD